MPLTLNTPIDQPLIMAIDIGTSSIRASIYDYKGNSINNFATQTIYTMQIGMDGKVEIPAEELATLVFNTIDKLIAQLGKRGYQIQAVGIASFWHSLLAIDNQNKPLTPLISWNDTRSTSLSQVLSQQIASDNYHQRTGCPIHACYWPTKILWLAKQLDTSQVVSWLSFTDYLFGKLFGEIATSVSLASATGLFNQAEGGWDQETLEQLQIQPAQLPKIIDLTEPIRGLKPAFADRWPCLAEIDWFWPVGDGACNSIGSGGFNSELFTLMIGTSGALRAIVPHNITISKSLWAYRIDSQRRILGGALSNGGNMLVWLRERLQLNATLAELNQELTQMPPDAARLTFLPFLSGERSPGWHDQATAAIIGLKLATTPLEILQAGLEAIGYHFATIYQEMVKLLGIPKEIIASGGALNHLPVWRAMLANILGTTLHMSEVAEASSRGIALLVLEQLGALTTPNLVELETSATYYSQSDYQTQYQLGLARYQEIYSLLMK